MAGVSAPTAAYSAFSPRSADGPRLDSVVEEVAGRIRAQITEALGAQQIAGDERAALIEQHLATGLRAEQRARMAAGLAPLPLAAENTVRVRVREALSPLGPMAGLLARSEFSDIEVNGAVNVICTDRATGVKTAHPSPFTSETQAFEWVAQQAAAAGRRFDDASPSVRCRLPGGARLHALAKITTLVHVDFRLFLAGLDTLEGLYRAGMFSPQVGDLLAATARLREPFGLIISGGTGAGKTTLLRGWLNAHPDRLVLDRVVTVEDEQELFLDRARFINLVDVETREPNIDGRGEYSMERYLSHDLRRQTPARLAVGELKPDGGVMPLLLALGQGIAQGVATTIHAPDAADVLSRLRTYAAFGQRQVDVTTVLETVAATVDLVVQVGRIDGRRVVTSIREYGEYRDGAVTSAELWRWDPRAGFAVRTDMEATPQLTAKLARGGLDPAVLRRARTEVTW